MEDSFRLRVEKAFGSLASSSLSSPWCLSDEEIQRREWNRDRDVTPDLDHDSVPYPPELDGFFASPQEVQPSSQILSRQLLSEELDDEGEDKPALDQMRIKRRRDGDGGCSSKPDLQADDSDWDIRSSIGLDCTLDYEEEEDQHDRFAVGRERASDRLYMKDMVEYGIDFNIHSELPGAYNKVNRDPRADHTAAKLRLREDAEAAGSFDSLNLSDISMPPLMHAQINELETGVNPKPILKKREIHVDARSAKRVRFEEPHLGTKDAAESCQVEDAAVIEGADNLPRDHFSKEEAKVADGIDKDAKEELCLAEKTSRVPDYLRNPSRYTRYILDSSDDMDDESNKKAYLEFLNLLKKPNATESEVDDTSVTSPKSLIFTPKKKAHDTSLANENMLQQNQVDASKDKALPVSIAAGNAQDGGVSAMEEDEPEIASDKSFSLQKQGRRYRTRTNADNDDHVT